MLTVLLFVKSPFMVHAVMLSAVTVPLFVKVPSTLVVHVPEEVVVMVPLLVRFAVAALSSVEQIQRGRAAQGDRRTTGDRKCASALLAQNERLMATTLNVTPAASTLKFPAAPPSNVTLAPLVKASPLSTTRLPVIVHVGEAAVEMDDPALLMKVP